jgi:PPOX class probable F420-dependent enzyme
MRTRVSEARVGRLATVTPSGCPHVVPCCFALSGGALYSAVDAKPKSSLALQRITNLRTVPSAALLVDHYSDDWPALWWIRVDGTARVIESGPERERALQLLAAKYEQYVRQPPRGPVIAIDITHWRAWP